MEIIDVERQHMGDAVNIHRCNQPGVMALLAGNAISYHKLLPFQIDSVRVVP